MPSKTQEYLKLANRTANGITRYWEHWTDFLTTASRLYKYSFTDQLMIYAQRPDATACASFDIWNNRMNRYVRRGSKGIALLDQSSSVPRLHYVFDVSDTGVRRNSRDPEVWQLNDDLFQPVSEMLAREYGIHHERLSQQIADIAGKLAESYWDNNSSDIIGIVDGSFLMDYDDAGQELQFKSAAAISIMYTILERCGFEPEGYFDRDDFQAIYDFSTPDAVYVLGTAVSDCSRDVLRNIERTVKTTIRRRNVERSQHEYEEQERDLLDRRGLPAPEPDLEPAAEAAGQIRQDAPDIPDGTSPGAVQLDAADREAASTSARSGTGSGESETADDDRTAEAEPSPGQSKESTGVGAAHEQPESTGGRSDPDGTDLQLSFFNLSIPTEAQQIEAIDRAENEKSSSAFSLSQAEIEHELQHGSNFQDASVDNMLCVTNDGRKIGLDVRLMNPMLPDDPNSKLNVCVRNVLKIWEEGKDQKLTQLLFCDLSTPKNDGNFNVYDDIRKKLIAAGVPENEIEFIHNADTEAKKAALFSKVRSGDVRVLLGSTAKMGAGTNVQQRLVAVHHLDVGWKPSDMTQRNGRIIRQGNMNKEVNVFNYVTEGTFDSYLFQTLENKQRFISQIMTSKSPVRSCDDVDEQALSYAEIKALCVGNPLIKEKMDLDVQVAKLKVLKADHQSQKFRLEDKLLTKFPAEIQEQTAKIAALKSDAEIAAAHPQDKENFCGMVIKGMTYDEKKTAGERLILACMELPNTEEQVVGSYRGFELSLRFDTFHNEHQALLKGTLKYPVPLGSDPHGNIVRLDNALSNFADRSTAAENELDTLRQQQAAAQVEVAKPFPQEEELAQKSARLAELNAQLDVDEKHHEPEQDEEEKEDAPRRSVLAVLEEKAEKAEPVKPFKSYLDKDGDAR